MPVKMTILLENGVEFNLYTPNQESVDKVVDKFNDKAVAAYDTETIYLKVRALRRAGFSATKQPDGGIKYEKDGVVVCQTDKFYIVDKPEIFASNQVFTLDEKAEMVGYALRLLEDA